MREMIKSIKKIISYLLIFTLLINVNNNIYAENKVNTDSADIETTGGGDESTKKYWDSTARGARVSLWDVETQTLIECKDMMTFTSGATYEKLSAYRRLSGYTKPEIISLNGTMTASLESNYENPAYTFGRNLYTESIEFPELFARTGQTGEERQRLIKEFYKQPEHSDKLKMALNTTEENLQKWKDGKACLLIEPLIGIVIYELVGEEKVVERWILTCAEVGLLALNGLASGAGKFYTGALSGTAYKALPYGTFKENDGLIKAIKPYTGSKTIYEAIHNNEGFKEMVNTLGCLEINTLDVATPSDTTPVDILLVYHPNLEQITGNSQPILNDTSLNSYWRIGENTKTETEINITKTYNDNIAPEPPEGSDPYKYEWYNLKPDCTGKRFKVDDTGKIPNEALEYEENKKESDKRGKKAVILPKISKIQWYFKGEFSNC